MNGINTNGKVNSALNTLVRGGWAARMPRPSVTGAARTVGVGLVLMVALAILAELLSVSTILAPEDAGALEGMREDGGSLALGVGIYAGILVLDALVAWGVYHVFRPVHRGYSLLSAALRMLYTAGLAVSLVALTVHSAETYIHGMTTAYIFFITHILILGYLAYVSGYVPRALGALLVVAAFCYVFLTYGAFVLSAGVNDAIAPVLMVPASLAEISLAIWLLVRAGRLPGMVGAASPTGSMAEA